MTFLVFTLADITGQRLADSIFWSKSDLDSIRDAIPCDAGHDFNLHGSADYRSHHEPKRKQAQGEWSGPSSGRHGSSDANYNHNYNHNHNHNYNDDFYNYRKGVVIIWICLSYVFWSQFVRYSDCLGSWPQLFCRWPMSTLCEWNPNQLLLERNHSFWAFESNGLLILSSSPWSAAPSF